MMLKKSYQQFREDNRVEAAQRKHIAQLRRQAQSGDTKAKKELEELVPQRAINRKDKRAFGVRSSLRHGAKKRRAWQGYLGGKLGL